MATMTYSKLYKDNREAYTALTQITDYLEGQMLYGDEANWSGWTPRALQGLANTLLCRPGNRHKPFIIPSGIDVDTVLIY